jgi:hypothetical protein
VGDRTKRQSEPGRRRSAQRRPRMGGVARPPELKPRLRGSSSWRSSWRHPFIPSLQFIHRRLTHRFVRGHIVGGPTVNGLGSQTRAAEPKNR